MPFLDIPPHSIRFCKQANCTFFWTGAGVEALDQAVDLRRWPSWQLPTDAISTINCGLAFMDMLLLLWLMSSEANRFNIHHGLLVFMDVLLAFIHINISSDSHVDHVATGIYWSVGWLYLTGAASEHIRICGYGYHWGYSERIVQSSWHHERNRFCSLVQRATEWNMVELWLRDK